MSERITNVHNACSVENSNCSSQSVWGFWQSTGREAAHTAQQHQAVLRGEMVKTAGNNLLTHTALEEATCRGEHSTWDKNCSGDGEGHRCEERCAQQLTGGTATAKCNGEKYGSRRKIRFLFLF